MCMQETSTSVLNYELLSPMKTVPIIRIVVFFKNYKQIIYKY